MNTGNMSTLRNLLYVLMAVSVLLCVPALLVHLSVDPLPGWVEAIASSLGGLVWFAPVVVFLCGLALGWVQREIRRGQQRSQAPSRFPQDSD